ncbi:hypothetical protein SKTS_26070 [Sulfurimicrobium lacus]|uniref:PKD/Chitinase domain-containing protein n=1 Tax=Sulfurimicrobium lacus TaxID=2715678 RepID=A0A6F8VEW7_9PROT|nr:Ig-like domain-containing protein [Sulfurimicrobium lacus]BCB27721.1 hypothetical protein SKTS_26070 [Sulfurimicrobium lacus]
MFKRWMILWGLAAALATGQAQAIGLTSPTAGQLYLAPASITLAAATTTSDGTVVKVEFYQGSTLIGTGTAAPYSINWTNTPAGIHMLTARATDKSGATTTSAPVQIIVDAPPTVSLTAPANKAVYIAPASVTLTATAGDSDGTISKVEYYQGTTLIGTATSAPYIATWQNAPAGQYSLTAKATDDKGATTTSTAVTIIVLPNQLPSITLTGPTAGQTFTAPATIDLAASAQDTDGQIARVEYYQGTTLIGTATAAPYSATWQNVAAGQYSLTAKAIDNGGGERYASAASITVSPAGLQVYYLHSDHLDTPRVVTDEQNRIVWRNDPLAEPFGTAAPEQDPDGDGVPFTLNLRFPGQYFDRETNLHYNYFRDYDPARGGYVTSDPIGLRGGINTYTYVNGNPLSYVDPLGLARTTVDSAIEQAIRRGDVGELQTLLEAANPEQASVIQRALTPARDLIRGQTRRSSSYASELEENSYAELCQMAKGKGDLANKAVKMKKLIEQQERLMEKLGGK